LDVAASSPHMKECESCFLFFTLKTQLPLMMYLTKADFFGLRKREKLENESTRIPLRNSIITKIRQWQILNKIKEEMMLLGPR
jgi:hypothetical protein